MKLEREKIRNRVAAKEDEPKGYQIDRLMLVVNRTVRVNPKTDEQSLFRIEAGKNLIIFYPVYPFEMNPPVFIELEKILEKSASVLVVALDFGPTFSPSYIDQIRKELGAYVIPVERQLQINEHTWEKFYSSDMKFDSDRAFIKRVRDKMLDISLENSSFYILEQEVVEKMIMKLRRNIDVDSY